MRISDWSSDVCSSDLDAIADAHADVAIARHDQPEMAGDQPLGDAAMVGNVRARCEDREEGAVEVGDAGDERRRSGAAREVLLDSVTVAVEKERAPLARFGDAAMIGRDRGERSEEHTSELQSLMRRSYA